MGSENRGFIVNYYTTFNGTKLTREELSDRVLKLLDSGGMTCGNIARTLKVTNQTIYNITHNLIQQKIITKSKDDHGIYLYRKVKECLLSDLLLPKAEEVEKAFKPFIVSRKSYRTENGTSKGSGRKGINFYKHSSISSVYWDE